MTNMHGEKGFSHTLGSAKSVPDVLIKNGNAWLSRARLLLQARPLLASRNVNRQPLGKYACGQWERCHQYSLQHWCSQQVVLLCFEVVELFVHCWKPGNNLLHTEWKVIEMNLIYGLLSASADFLRFLQTLYNLERCHQYIVQHWYSQ